MVHMLMRQQNTAQLRRRLGHQATIWPATEDDEDAGTGGEAAASLDVESLDAVNGLVNFWWRQSPAFMDTPLNTLMMALLSLRDLPPAQRDAWRALFDHYVFDADAQTAAHIPAPARGVLAPMNEHSARQLRAMLLNRLKR